MPGSGRSGRRGLQLQLQGKLTTEGGRVGLTRSTPYGAGGAQEEFEGSLLFTWELREALRSVQRKIGAGLGQVRNILVQEAIGPRLAPSSLDLKR